MPVRTLQECLDEFVAERPLQPDEYPDAVSGLAYCKHCHSPRRTRQVLFGKERILLIGCRCQMEDAALFRAAAQMAISSGRISAPKRRHPNMADFHTKKEKA